MEKTEEEEIRIEKVAFFKDPLKAEISSINNEGRVGIKFSKDIYLFFYGEDVSN